MDRFQSNGRLIAGVSFDIPGMGYKNPQTGAITGFEADLARAVGEKIFDSADRVDFFQVTDAERIQDLQEGRVDFVASQLTITPDRAEQVDFSTPYCVTREGLLVPKGSSIGRFEDLKGKRIAVTDGSVSLRRMRAALPSLSGATLVITPLSAGNLDAIDKGEADAASNDMINLTMLRAGSAHRSAIRSSTSGTGSTQSPSAWPSRRVIAPSSASSIRRSKTSRPTVKLTACSTTLSQASLAAKRCEAAARGGVDKSFSTSP